MPAPNYTGMVYTVLDFKFTSMVYNTLTTNRAAAIVLEYRRVTSGDVGSGIADCDP